MARIIESTSTGRRIIKLSTDDIISVVKEYQHNVTRNSDYLQTRNILEDVVIYLPEDI